MRLEDALTQISEIRSQLVQTETVRDFRSLTVGFSGVLGIAAAWAQKYRIPRPAEQVEAYVSLWVGIALVSLLVVGVELLYRCYATHSATRRRLTLLAVAQFTPCLVAGASVTAIIATQAGQIAWTLPGLWAIFFGLGICAVARLLPRATIGVGAYYLASGSICLATGLGPMALSPWTMVFTFGFGQLLAAATLYFTLERRDEQV